MVRKFVTYGAVHQLSNSENADNFGDHLNAFFLPLSYQWKNCKRYVFGWMSRVLCEDY